MAEKLDFQAFPLLKEKSARRDSNPRPRPWQGRAPPTEPLAHFLVLSQAQDQLYAKDIYMSSIIFHIFYIFFNLLELCKTDKTICL